jgi:hypothetical protein
MQNCAIGHKCPANNPADTRRDGCGCLQSVDASKHVCYCQQTQISAVQPGVSLEFKRSFKENAPVGYRPTEALDWRLRTKTGLLLINDLVVTRASRTARSQ